MVLEDISGRKNAIPGVLVVVVAVGGVGVVALIAHTRRGTATLPHHHTPPPL